VKFPPTGEPSLSAKLTSLPEGETILSAKLKSLLGGVTFLSTKLTSLLDGAKKSLSYRRGGDEVDGEVPPLKGILYA
jgi:hypothetical protein